MTTWMLVIIVGLVALAAREAWLIRQGFKSQRWTQTTGTLQRIWQEQHDAGEDSEATHSVFAHYTYKVDGRIYEGKRLSYRTMQSLSFDEALDHLHGRRKGSEVDVYYDPGKPQRAVLYPGSSAGNVVLLATWIVGATLTMALR